MSTLHCYFRLLWNEVGRQHVKALHPESILILTSPTPVPFIRMFSLSIFFPTFSFQSFFFHINTFFQAVFYFSLFPGPLRLAMLPAGQVILYCFIAKFNFKKNKNKSTRLLTAMMHGQH